MSEKGNEVDGNEVDDMMMEDEKTEDKVDEATDAELAEDALEATKDEEVPDKSEKTDEEEPAAEEQTDEETQVDPKDAVIGGFRKKNRDLELENAKLQGQLEVRESIAAQSEVEEVVKSPLELAEEAHIKEYGEIPPEGIQMTSKLYNEQRAFDVKQAEKPADANQVNIDPATEVAFDFLQEGSLSVEKAGEGKDLKSVLLKASEVLTDGELLDLKNFGSKNTAIATLRQTYNVTVAKFKEAGTWKAPAKKVTKEAQNKERKLKSDDIDDLMTKEDDNTTDSDKSDTNKLASFIVSATGS